MATRELNETLDLLECEAVNGCLDEETEEKATTCRDAIMVSVRFLLFKQRLMSTFGTIGSAD